MKKLNERLNDRLKLSSNETKKLSTLAQKSSKGELSSFNGLFKTISLSENEREDLSTLVEKYQTGKTNITDDLKVLSSLTSEIKAINHQAVLLHGERIKKAQQILRFYREGAFTSWLITAYGNRQTPYNFLQYYEFYSSLSDELKQKVELMPRQIIYTLASRQGNVEEKKKMIAAYQGESKLALLNEIRKKFPLSFEDKRTADLTSHILNYLKKAHQLSLSSQLRTNEEDKQEILSLLKSLRYIINKK